MTESCSRRYSDASSERTIHKARKTPSTKSPNARSTPTKPLEATFSLPTEKSVVPKDPVFTINAGY